MTIYTKKEVVLTGFALFAMLFGAGNLIFPPSVGYETGANWQNAAMGFFITGIGFPLAGIIAAGFSGSELDNFSNKVSKLFSKIFNIVLILAIGPFLAIPRTGATAFEVGLSTHIGDTTSIQYIKIIFLILYYLLVLIFSLRENRIIDIIGKILTPILLVVLTIIIFKGVITPIGEVVPTSATNIFRYGFQTGYQTMDTLAAIIFASIILKGIKTKVELNEREKFLFLLKASMIAVIGLVIVYGGLLYIGASATSLPNVGKTQFLSEIVGRLLGKYGSILLGMCVAGACLTTAIGLTATVGDYFSSLLKTQYEKIVILTSVISLFFATFGVEQIVKVSVPILIFIYPIAIILIILNLFRKYLKTRGVFIGSVIGAGLVGLIEVLQLLNIAPQFVNVIYNKLPFTDYGLSWVAPSIIFGTLVSVLENYGFLGFLSMETNEKK